MTNYIISNKLRVQSPNSQILALCYWGELCSAFISRLFPDFVWLLPVPLHRAEPKRLATNRALGLLLLIPSLTFLFHCQKSPRYPSHLQLFNGWRQHGLGRHCAELQPALLALVRLQNQSQRPCCQRPNRFQIQLFHRFGLG